MIPASTTHCTGLRLSPRLLSTTCNPMNWYWPHGTSAISIVTQVMSSSGRLR